MRVSFHLDGADFDNFQKGKKVQLPDDAGLSLSADMITIHCLPTEVTITREKSPSHDGKDTFVQKKIRKRAK